MLGKGSRAPADVLLPVRRVGEDEIKPLARRRQLGQGGEHILHPHLQGLGREAGRLKILAQHLRVARGLLHAHRRGRAAAEAFEAQRARAGKQFQHPRADHAPAEAVEYRLLDQVRRGPHRQALRHFQNPASGFSTRNAHKEL